jgi:hypothetical protein
MAAGGMRSPCDSRRECRRPTNGQGSSCAMGPAGGGPGWSECGVSLCGSAVGSRAAAGESRAPCARQAKGSNSAIRGVHFLVVL